MSVTVEEIRDRPAWDSLESAWNSLLSRSPYDLPFMRHEWISTWTDCFADQQDQVTIIANDGDELLFGLPLMESQVGRGPITLRILKSATNSHSFKHHFLCNPQRPDVMEEVWRHLHTRRDWHVLLLAYVPLGHPVLTQFLDAASRWGHKTSIKPMYESAFLPISGTWDQHLGKLKHSFKKTMRRQDNRLKELGDVRVEVLSERSEILEALPEAWEIERRSWKGVAGSAIACQPSLVQFYSQLSDAAALRGWMRLSFLRIAGERAAFEYGFEYGGRFYSIKIGFDPEKYRAYSVGRRLVHESIGRCFQKQLCAYDFVGAYSSAQEHWQPELSSVGWVYVYNQRWLAKAHHFGEFKLKPVVKNVLRRFRRR